MPKRPASHPEGLDAEPHSERQGFVVTGKIDYLVDLVRFIRDEENLPIEEGSEEGSGSQEALL